MKKTIINRYKCMLIEQLKKDINLNFHLIGVPKHMNLGDTLIWEAENALFKEIHQKKLNTYFFYTKPSDMNIKNDEIIIFNGGGYFGDVWNFMSYSEKIFNTYRKNKIIFMPNSVFFIDKNNIKLIYERLKKHDNEVIIYCREEQAYKICEENFNLPNVKFYLLPDVVLTWDVEDFCTKHGIKITEGNNKLYISRNDKEKNCKIKNNDFTCVSDWPTIKKTPKYVNNTLKCNEWENKVKDKLIIDAIQFIMPYKTVYSDRMHGGILAMLLGKETYLINNSYGKTKFTYINWLTNIDNIKLYENE